MLYDKSCGMEDVDAKWLNNNAAARPIGQFNASLQQVNSEVKEWNSNHTFCKTTELLHEADELAKR